MASLNPYLKAITGAVVAGLTALLTALDDDAVTRAEWVIVAIATLTALGVVWATPWLPRPPKGGAPPLP